MTSPAAEAAAADLAFRATPNPVSLETTLRFTLPRSGIVSLELFDLSGHQVAVLVDGERAAGEQSVALSTDRLAPGMYFAALRYDGRVSTRSVVVVK
jgi:hypothetical protein